MTKKKTKEAHPPPSAEALRAAGTGKDGMDGFLPRPQAERLAEKSRQALASGTSRKPTSIFYPLSFTLFQSSLFSEEQHSSTATRGTSPPRRQERFQPVGQGGIEIA
jgi:hypothetical protein